MNCIFFIFFTLFSMTTFGAEFLYPVAMYTDTEADHTQKLLVLHQKTGTIMELWSWDPMTHIADKMLPSSFCPAGVALLPSNKGFSFIDNGRIRIKEFIKRSARSIDIPYGVSALGPVTWHANGLGYFHALRNGHYALFSITVSGDVDCCLARSKTDCLYPSWFKESLFYVERTDSQQFACRYRIVEQSAATDNSDPLRALCVDFGNRPIICLNMIGANEGFFLEHAPKIDTTATTVTFLYYQLTRIDKNSWHINHLFSFSIPATLLDNASDTHVYESILPLVPRIYGSTVYYVDGDALRLSVCSYNLVTHKKKSGVSPYNSALSFVPIRCNSLLFFGGRIQPDAIETNSMPCIYIDSDNSDCFSLPCLPYQDINQ